MATEERRDALRLLHEVELDQDMRRRAEERQRLLERLDRTSDGVVRGTAFKLVDKKGKVRATLGMDKNGPTLELFDTRGMTRAALCVHRNMPGLALLDENGKVRIILSVPKGIGPVLNLDDAKGKNIWSAP